MNIIPGHTEPAVLASAEGDTDVDAQIMPSSGKKKAKHDGRKSIELPDYQRFTMVAPDAPVFNDILGERYKGLEPNSQVACWNDWQRMGIPVLTETMTYVQWRMASQLITKYERTDGAFISRAGRKLYVEWVREEVGRIHEKPALFGFNDDPIVCLTSAYDCDPRLMLLTTGQVAQGRHVLKGLFQTYYNDAVFKGWDNSAFVEAEELLDLDEMLPPAPADPMDVMQIEYGLAPPGSEAPVAPETAPELPSPEPPSSVVPPAPETPALASVPDLPPAPPPEVIEFDASTESGREWMQTAGAVYDHAVDLEAMNGISYMEKWLETSPHCPMAMWAWMFDKDKFDSAPSWVIGLIAEKMGLVPVVGKVAVMVTDGKTLLYHTQHDVKVIDVLEALHGTQ